MNSSAPATPSKNPFINPPNSNNPFLRKPSAGQPSTSDSEDATVIDAAQRYPQLPPEPPAGVPQATPQLPPIPPHPTGMVLTPMPPVVPTQVPPPVSPPPLPARRPTQPVPAETPATPSISRQPQQQPILEVNSEPVRNPDNMTDDEALAAAIQASLNLVDGPVFTPPPGPPPGRSSSSPSTPQPTRRTSPPAPVEAQPTGASSTPSNPPPPFELEPPPYTPSPDVYTETTVEVGPRRPFQNPTRAQPRRVPGGYPGSVGRQRTGASSADLGTSWRADVTIPPSDSGPSLTPQATGWSARSSSQPDLTLLDSSSSTGGSFSPPPGPPSSSRSSAPRNPETSEDDGKPTTSPTPGRPLLNKGKTLVYPAGYFCHKCNNTGYKSFDPSNPCSKCWPKYARDYSGTLTYAPWGNRPADTNFQRPLPRTFGPGSTALSLQRGQSSARPSWNAGPGESYRSTSSSWGGSSSNVSLCRTFSSSLGPRRLTKGRLAVAIASEIASAVGGSNHNRYGTHSRDHSPQVARSLGLPPPGSVVVRPGDPRIGGKRCWHCGGDGTISFFLFEERCPTCRGTGRVGI